MLRIIAEIGSNWVDDSFMGGVAPPTPLLSKREGMSHATNILRAIDAAARAGATGVKFQLGLDKLYSQERAPAVWQRLQNYAFPIAFLPKAHEYAKERGLELWASVFDVALFETIGVAGHLDGIKVASGDITYRPIVVAVAKMAREQDIPMALSTGAAERKEFLRAVDWAYGENPPEVILMACDSSYPASIENVNLHYLLAHREDVDALGYSDHTLSVLPAQLAVALGYTMFEKHLLPWPNPNAPDTCVSLDVADFARYVKAIRDADALVAPRVRVFSVSEKQERTGARRGEDGLRPAKAVV